MKTRIKKFPVAILLVILCMTVFPLSALAADEVEVSIPVSIELSGETPSPDETYTIVLEAIDDAPMPAESTLNITGDGKAAFPAISYSTPGVYCYKISQQAGKHERGHYDTTVYYVRVTVTNAEAGGLEATVAAHTDAQMVSAKRDIAFENTYDAVEIPSEPGKTETSRPAKTGDNTDLGLLITLLCISGCGISLILAENYRKRHLQ